jgi:phenylpropionate dioxygenase-like ring-hydroxylating dioxygenase large terminal subunit
MEAPMTDLRPILQALAALPADRPMGLPGSFYTSPERFEWERKTALQKGWHCLGRQDELPEPGDFFTVQLLEEPLIVVRGDDQAIRGLAIVCRHRGMPLADGRGNVKRFVCPYHAWMYGRAGALLRAARMKNEGFDPSSCNLHSYNIQFWNGFIYCNLDVDAPHFGEESLELDELLEPYDLASFRLVHVAEEVWKTNWKCLVENFMEGYHLSVVHPQTLHEYTPTGLAKKSASGPDFTSYMANYPDAAAPRGLGSPKLSQKERQRSTLFARFPTQVASQAASLLVSLSIFPISAESIQVKWTMSVYGDDLDEDAIQGRIKLWEEVNKEDREKLEKMQIALRSKHAQSGPLAADDYEGTIRDFQNWLALQDRLALE